MKRTHPEPVMANWGHDVRLLPSLCANVGNSFASRRFPDEGGETLSKADEDEEGDTDADGQGGKLRADDPVPSLSDDVRPARLTFMCGEVGCDLRDFDLSWKR